MTNVVSGTVYKVFEKQWRDKTLYSIKLDGNEDYYGSGSVRPNCQAGDNVEFEWEQKGKYKNAIPATVKVTGQGTTSAPAKSGGGGGARDDYWAKKDAYDKEVRQRIIAYQSATKDACTLAVAALNNGILPSAGSSKKDKWQSFRDTVLEVRDEIYASYDEAMVKLEAGEPLIEIRVEGGEENFSDEWEE